MAITITANDSNRDGRGIDFGAYMASFNNRFVSDGYGEFNDDLMSGSQYGAKNAAGWGAVLTAGATRWEYDINTHVVTGSLSTIAFGTDVALNNATERFTYKLDVQIAGLGITNTTLGGNILADIMDGNTASLVARLKLDTLNFKGSTGNDSFTAYGRNDLLSGNAGNDVLRGGGGNDRVLGGAGNDKLFGDIGNDVVRGGAGIDTLNGGAGHDRLYGDADNDSVTGAGGNDTLYGGTGNDVLRGDEGNDKLFGEAGNDRLIGGAGNDVLNGGGGNDQLTGGGGADTFLFVRNGGNDTVMDFQAGAARLDVLRLDNAVLRNFADVLAHADDVAAGVRIEYGNSSILLRGIDVADLHQNDFFFF